MNFSVKYNVVTRNYRIWNHAGKEWAKSAPFSIIIENTNKEIVEKECSVFNMYWNKNHADRNDENWVDV